MSGSPFGRTCDEAGLVAVATALAPCLQPGTVLFLRGELGAGKTTFVRALLRALGWDGPVKSPTYTLVESYPLAAFPLHHFDLYRLADPDELTLVGIRDYCDGRAVLAVEWPDKGGGRLPSPDLTLVLDGQGDERRLRLEAHSACGALAVQGLAESGDAGGKAG